MKTLEQVVDELTRGESLAERSRWLVFGALAIWIATSALAMDHAAPEQFARAGAIGTGLVLAAFAFSTLARQHYETTLMKGLVLVLRSNLRDREGRPLMLPDAVPEPAETAVRDYDHNLEALARLFARLDRTGTKAREAEVGAAVLATLQWGYGDLAIKRAVVCGRWRC